MPFLIVAVQVFVLVHTNLVETRITELHKAAREGDLNAVKKILSDHPTLVDQPPVFRKGFKAVPDPSTALQSAACFGHTEIVRFLLKSGANPNASAWGMRPLHHAVTCGHTEIVQLLLEQKADPNARGRDGWTPLANAASTGRTEIALLLIKAGADVEAMTDHIPPKPIYYIGRPPGFTDPIPARSPAQIARDLGHEELAKLLTRQKG